MKQQKTESSWREKSTRKNETGSKYMANTRWWSVTRRRGCPRWNANVSNTTEWGAAIVALRTEGKSNWELEEKKSTEKAAHRRSTDQSLKYHLKEPQQEHRMTLFIQTSALKSQPLIHQKKQTFRGQNTNTMVIGIRNIHIVDCV